MAATLFGMTIDECIAGVTRNAAGALGLQGETGTLTVGKRADIAIWNADKPSELVYRMGFNPLHARFFNGKGSRP
jgi:imidazolonepropionase